MAGNYLARSSEIFCINSSRIISPFSINIFASASVWARLEMTSVYLVLALCSSFEHLVGSSQHVWRHRHADLF
jgi:hypothetical protein